MPLSLDCLLIADDLTGACDAAVYFAGTVLFAGGAHAYDARVVALTTESRDLPAPEIRSALFAAAARFPADAAARVFKKIDSTLRGNTGVELAAALEAFHCDAALVCPAFPKMHRVVETGCLRVTTAPEFDPIDVAALLQMQSGIRCVHTGPDGIASALTAGARLVCVDAACDADLDRIAAVILPMGRRILWAGSAGLASALARLLDVERASLPAVARRGGALFCIGSDHPVTLVQQEALLEERPTVLAGAADSLPHALAHGKHVLLRIQRGLATAKEVRLRITGVPAAGFVLSGGDTASLVCRAAGVQRIQLCGEIVPGVPRGILQGGEFDGAAVVTKSGGFGNRDTLIQVADYFTCPSQTLS